MAKRICAIEGCNKPHRTRGFCGTHYKQVWRKERPFVACTIDGCDEQLRAAGLCSSHYARWKRTGVIGGSLERAAALKCSMEECGRAHHAQGLCKPHYLRWLKTGDAGSPEIRVTADSRIRDENGHKLCTRCREWLPTSSFANAKKSSDGLAWWCRRCHRAGVLRRTYGVTIEWYEATLAAQENGCALCGESNNDGRMLAVDHDHACCSGRRLCGRCARSLLCTKCNTGLGAFGDNIALLQAAIDYLRRGTHGIEAAAP